jgi:HSP20 family protein
MKTTVETQPVVENRHQETFIVPEVNIVENHDGYVLEAEMPGVDKDGLQITLEGTQITITGRRKAATSEGETLFRERQSGDFRRVFELDPVIDTSRISAHMEQGLLTLTLPKSERVKPRKIKVD